MRKLFFCLLISLFTLSAQANTIHWFTFVDTTDPNVGAFDVTGRELLYTQWINKINAALSGAGYTSKIYDNYGSLTSPENCKQLINDFSCGENDIVVFYYIGHGARAYNDRSKYPQMCLAQEDEKKCVPLVWVHETLKQNSPRLLITIGMCCNSYAPELSAKESIAFNKNYGTASYSSNEVEAIRKMFLENKGDIIMSSSSASQPSWAFFIPNLGKTMDIFTFGLVANYAHYVKETSSPSWHTLLGRVATDVNNFALYNGRQQMPQYDIDVTKVSRPTKEVRKETTIPEVKPQNETKSKEIVSQPEVREEAPSNDMAQALTEVFDNLIDDSVSFSDKVRRANILKSKISDNAVVRMIAEDDQLVIDKMSLHDYIDIVSTSKRYYKISVISTDVNDNKITSIRVREYVKTTTM